MSKSLQNLISVIVVSWNVADSLERCLQSLESTKYELEVIVIDNDSSDDSVEIAKKFSFATIIKNPKNMGFPRAVNQGLLMANGDYVLILNPDASVEKDFFKKAVAYAVTNPRLGAMGPKFINPDGTIQGSVFPEPSIRNTIKQYWLGVSNAASKYTPAVESPVTVNAISGGAMFVPRSTIEKVGYFTEEVFMYYEDLDYCRRIRNSGLDVIFNPQVSVIHEHGQSAAKSSKSYSYLVSSSKWYNGLPKHYLLTGIIWTSQKMQKLFGAGSANKI